MSEIMVYVQNHTIPHTIYKNFLRRKLQKNSFNQYVHNVKYEKLAKMLQLLLHLFNGLFSRTTWLSQYQKGKTSLDLNEARYHGVWRYSADTAGPYANNLCTSLQTDNHTSSLNFYRLHALPDAQKTQPGWPIIRPSLAMLAG